MIVTPAEALASVARPPAARGRRTLTELAQGFLRWLDAHHRPQTTIASYGDGLGAFPTFAAAIGMVYPDQSRCCRSTGTTCGYAVAASRRTRWRTAAQS